MIPKGPRLPIIGNRIPILTSRTVPLPALRQAEHTIGKEHAQWAAAVKKRAGYACEKCGRHDVRMFADHIVEVADGGSFDLNNGQCLCGSCHTKKTIEQKKKRELFLRQISSFEQR
jgi:5-methylcytosine-specific restriction enzyme A